jgi:hypothetical protein
MAFYLEPATVVVVEGETFMTQCRLMSLDKSQADRIELVIKYEPKYVEPISIHHERIWSRLAEPPQWGMDRAMGEIHYAARFTERLDGINNPLISIVWRALLPAEGLRLELHHDGRASQAWLDDQLMTQNEFGPVGALIGSTLRVLARPDAVPKGERLVERALRDFAPALAPLGEIDDRPPVLWLDYERRANYEADQWIVMDVRLANPAGTPFDELRFALSYDPEVLEFLDTDEGNWIRGGANILDGPFRERWDWDLHLTNRIDPVRGRIEYRMGRTALRRQTEGVVARMIARVKTPAGEPLIDWIVNGDETPDRPTTGIYLLGENLLERYARRIAVGPERSLDGRTRGAEAKADPAIYRD